MFEYEVCLHRAGERPRWVGVANGKEAADVVRTWVEQEGMGASEWAGAAGEVRRRATRERVARVSYNGRIWDVAPYPACKEIRF